MAPCSPWPEQCTVLQDAATRQDTVVGFPTGKGKSLCFLYGGLLRRRGLTLVIGPLVATNFDMVAKLNARAREHESTHAGPIADSLGGAALADPADALRSALCAGIEVLFCTPESFIRASAALGWAHRQRPFELVAIDEAATVIMWEFRSSHGTLAPQLREWLPGVPRMACSASLSPEMLHGAVQAACDLKSPRMHLHHEPRHNLVAHVLVGGTATQLLAALGFEGPPPSSAEADAAFGAFLKAARWGIATRASGNGGEGSVGEGIGGEGGGGGEGDDDGEGGGGGGEGDDDGDEASAQAAEDEAAEQAAEEASGTATTEADLQAALAMARPATSSSPPPPGGAAAATAAVRASKIVYVRTRKAAEALAAYLAMWGVSTGVYHAGWRERARVAACWHSGKIEIVCATIAFGLGVDNPNVTHVVTWGYEPELDQQWGRAGRGGQPAHCTLIVPSLAPPRLATRRMSTMMEQLARWRLRCVHAAATYGAGGGDAWFPLLGVLYDRWYEPATAQLPSTLEDEPVPYSEYLDEVGVVRAMLSALAVALAVVPTGEDVAQAGFEALTLVGPYARPNRDGSPHWADWRAVHHLQPPPGSGAPVKVPAITYRAALLRLLQLHGPAAATALDELHLHLGLNGLLERAPQPPYDAATAAAELRRQMKCTGDEDVRARGPVAASAPAPLLFAGLTPDGWAVLRGAAAPPEGLLVSIRSTAEGHAGGGMPRMRAALEGDARRWLIETALAIEELEDKMLPMPPPDLDLEAATCLEPERLQPGGVMALVWNGTPAEQDRIAVAVGIYQRGLAAAAAAAATARHIVGPTPATREPTRAAADVAAQVAEQLRMQAALMRARGAYAWRGVVPLVRHGRTMTASAADFLACLALVHRVLGRRSPFGGAAPGGLDAALAKGLDVVRGHVRMAEVPVAATETELQPLVATARVSAEPSSRALSIEPRVCGTKTYQGALSGAPWQASSAAVPGAKANCLALLVRGQPRPELPVGAVFANLMLAAAASDGRPQLWETEGYQLYCPVTSWDHAIQTVDIGSGRVAVVRQRHGLLSLTLVCWKNGKPEPSYEATLLHRGF